ncbi:hypothetical protein CZ674_01435 [Agrococcus casei LMG 22410]|uniref:Uncharacterized protein n=2 Tax=Agrococcus TaxID=46352 RepID=A0A1R4EXB2_9MICO|nr:hypothetical protein CZ674_01435 [Agrococcus casei LMG 22410]
MWRDVLVMTAAAMAFVLPVSVIAVASPADWWGVAAYVFVALGIIALALVTTEVLVRALVRLAHGGTQNGVFVIALCITVACLVVWMAAAHADDVWGARVQIVAAAPGAAAAAHFACEAAGAIRALRRRRYVGQT